MKADEIIKRYKEIKYIANNGLEYHLCEKYPICIYVEGNEDQVFLDTGGPMETCEFFKAIIQNGYIYRIMPGRNGDISQKLAKIIFERR